MKYLEPLDDKSKGMMIVLAILGIMSIGYFMRAEASKYVDSSTYVSSTSYVGSTTIATKYPSSVSIVQ